MPLFGAHMSISGGLHKALLRGEKIGCRAVQIFTGNRNQWKTKALSTEAIGLFHETLEKTSIELVAVHDSYLINLASSRSDVAEKSFKALLVELQRVELLKIPYLVIHPGAHLGDGEKEGLRRITGALNRLHAGTKGFGVKILLETTAGQGTNLGYRFEHFAEILERTESSDRLGVCFDTCHAFAAGYDFRTPKSYRRLFRTFDNVIGIDRLKLFHINDSKTGLGSRVDRHEHPGNGHIGLGAFSHFVNDARFAGLPFLLETPKGKDIHGIDMDVVNLDRLKRLKESGHKR